ncbi:GNAT family N-acetyltransferase [Lactococcus allomyrinae]|nr:GNAT family N-acetyltransferase [Lactococcus allomyrinae]
MNTSHWRQPIVSSDKIEALTEEELKNGVLRNSGYRFYKEEDFDVFVKYLMENWNLGYKKAKISHRLAAEIYAHFTLSESQIMIVDKFKTSGFASYQCALITEESECQVYHKAQFEKLISAYPSIKPYYEAESKIENFQKQKSNNYLQILIVGKKYQGQNIGKTLFEFIRNIEYQLWFKNQNHDKANLLQELSVYTTTDCNVSFYERLKGKLVYEESSIPDGDIPAKAMIFRFPVLNYSWE